ncbi:MAG: DUF2971 domain-containing protein [Flavobacteriaceae bacterium]
MNTFKIDESQELIRKEGKDNLWILHVNGVPQSFTPSRLYKYYGLNENNIDAIKNSYLYLNNPAEFNDPFDCSYNLIKEKQIRPVDRFPVPTQNNVGNKGICCFSTVDNNPLMWPHYTDSYNGFVIKMKHTFRIVQEEGMAGHRLMRVIYSNDPSKVSETMPFANSYQLGVKLAHWSYENEWRLVIDKTDNNFRKLKYIKEDIEEFIFGFKFLVDKKDILQNELRDKLLKIIRDKFPDVPKFIMGPDFNSFKLKKVPLYEARDIYDFNFDN